jgi:KipI family sensor histidine kinase inhibitor
MLAEGVSDDRAGDARAGGTADLRLEIGPYGDSGLLVAVRCADPEHRWATAQALAESLWTTRPAGLLDLVASYDDLVLSFDPLVTDHAELRRAVRRASDAPFSPRPSRAFVLPAVYGSDHGPDLREVADELGVTPDQVVELHTAVPWVVRFRGAPVGAPMLDGGRTLAPVARRGEPRTRVVPGSVAISGLQSTVYPVASPGGWRLIGRTPLRLVDVSYPSLVPYRPGDTIRFVPIAAADWSRWEGRLADRADELVAAFGEAAAAFGEVTDDA